MEVFAAKCATCHGTDARWQGQLAAALAEHPILRLIKYCKEIVFLRGQVTSTINGDTGEVNAVITAATTPEKRPDRR